MEWIDILKEIFEVCVIPLLGVLTTFLVKFINDKAAQAKENSENELIQNYITMLADTISDCVIATNQTYVESLKKSGNFDAEAQKEAFSRTYAAVMDILSNDAKEYLQTAYGDLEKYINTKIETEVNLLKE